MAIVQPALMNSGGGVAVVSGRLQRKTVNRRHSSNPAASLRPPRVVRSRSTKAAAHASYGDNKPTPPPNFMSFKVKKTLRVPVEEPSSVRASSPSGSSSQSLERWVQSPGNVMGVVFTADYVTQLRPDLWRIQVLRLPLLDWELSPEFDLTILPPEASARPGGVRMISDQLRFSGEKGVDKLPPGFASMPIWTHIDSTLYIERGGGRPTAVCSDLEISVAADIPGVLRMIPFFQEIGESAISTSIDVVGAGAQKRVQAAYETWVERSAAAEVAAAAAPPVNN